MNFGNLETGFADIPREQQLVLLQGFSQFRYSQIKLSQCEVDDEEPWEEILKTNSECLKVLKIHFCKGVGEKTLILIAENCKNLEELEISGWNELKKIRYKKKALHFPKLNKLTIQECAKLSSIKLSAPNLSEINVTDSKLLEKLKVKSINDPQKRFTGCTKLKKPLFDRLAAPSESESSTQLKRQTSQRDKEKKRSSTPELSSSSSLKEGVSPRREAFRKNSQKSSYPTTPKSPSLLEEKKRPSIPRLILEEMKDLPELNVKALFKKIAHPDVLLQKIKGYSGKKPNESTISKFFEATLDSKITRDIKEFVNKNPQINYEKCLKIFFDYLLDLSGQVEAESLSSEEYTVEKIDLFTADGIGLYQVEVLPKTALPLPSFPPDELKIPLLLSFIDQAKAATDQITQDKDALFLIGPSGAGKSTTINYLAGCRITLVPAGPDELSETKLFVEDPVALVGDTIESKTSVPGVFSLPDHPVFLCDLPGFFETRGPELSIANAVSMRNLLAKCRSGRILFLVLYSNISDPRGQGSREAIETLIRFFASVNELTAHSSSILIGVTHVPKENLKFEVLKKRFQQIALQQEWDFKDEWLSNIIPIDPLLAGKRQDLLDQLVSLPPISYREDTYYTALSDSDRLRIKNIAEACTAKIRFYWQEANIAKIVDEFATLASLRPINHESIEKAIDELQRTIAEKVQALSERIQALAAIDQPDARLEVKEKMRQLDDCCKLNVCFLPEIGQVTKEFEKAEEAVRVAERHIQLGVNRQITLNLDFLLQALAKTLDKAASKEGERLAALDLDDPDLLAKLIDTVDFEAAASFKTLFEQIDLEIKLRPLKYYSGELLAVTTEVSPLAKLKADYSEKVQNRISDTILKAKLAQCSAKFNRVLRDFEAAVEVNAAKYTPILSQKRIEFRDFAELAKTGFHRKDLKILIDSLLELTKLLSDSDSAVYREKIDSFLNKLFGQALFFFVDEALNFPLVESKQLEDLNHKFGELQVVNQELFEKVKSKLKEKIITASEGEVGQIAAEVDEDYLTTIDALLALVQCMDVFKVCFSDEEAAAHYQHIEKGLLEKEESRRDAEIQVYRSSLEPLIQAAKASLKEYAENSFYQIVSLFDEYKAFENRLLRIQNIKEVSTFSVLWTRFEKACKTESKRYRFIANADLEKMREDWKTELSQTFDYTFLLGQTLSLKEKLIQVLEVYRAKGVKIIEKDPKQLLDTQVRNKIERESLQPLTSEMLRIKKEAKNLPSELETEIKEHIETIREIHNQYMEDLLLLAKEASVAGSKDELHRICNERDFEASTNKLAKLLDEVKINSPAAYPEVCKSLHESIASWASDAKNVDEMAQRFSTLNNIESVLKNHIDIRSIVKKFHNEITAIMSQLNENVINVIVCDSEKDDFYETVQLEQFVKVAQNFSEAGRDVKQEKAELKKLAMSQWKRLEEIAQLPNPLNSFAKMMIKQYAVALELDLLDAFKDFIQSNIFIVRLSEENIYYLGCKLKKIAVKESSISKFARGLLDSFIEFQRVNTGLFNTKAKGVDFEAALKDFKANGETNKERLLSFYKEFNRIYTDCLSEIIKGPNEFKEEVNKETIFRLAKTFKSTPLGSKPYEALELLARIFAQWTYLNSAAKFFSGDKNTLLQPHCTQILAIFRLMGIDNEKGTPNHLAQVNTGEGKSICLGITAALFSLIGYDVSVVCYSSYLSERDNAAFSELFKALQIRNSITYSTIDDLVGDCVGKFLPNYFNLTDSFLKGHSPYSFSPSKKPNLLLIDEVDVFFGENFYGKSKCYASTLRSKEIEELFHTAWAKRGELNSMAREPAIAALRELECTKQIVRQFPNLEPFLPHILNDLLISLRKFPASGENNSRISYQGKSLPYLVENNKIGLFDNGGNRTFNYVGFNFAFNYIYHHERKTITDEFVSKNLLLELTCANILFTEIPKLFDLKLGLTATLTDLSQEENDILENGYQFTHRSFIPSTFKDKKIAEFKETQVFTGERKKEYYQAIQQDIKEKTLVGRATLVVFDSPESVEAFENYLDNEGKKSVQVKTLTEKVPDHQKESIIIRAISQYKNTLISRLYGRGVDFVCRDSGLVASGGVHVIFTFYPETTTEELQIRGRTCRQDDPGTIKKILFAEDLCKQGFLPRDSNNLPDLSHFHLANPPTTWDKLLEQKRKEKNTARYQRLEETLRQNERAHLLSIQLAEAGKSRNHEESTRLLLELNGYPPI